MKGVILAGGSGSRLHPLTLAISKQLLPVFDKPLIYYPLSTLMLAGIREMLIIVTPQNLDLFRLVLGDGSQFGIQIEFIEQDAPKGIAHGLILADNFLHNESFALILGDNVFYGAGLGRTLSKYSEINGAHVFTHRVHNPQSFGVLEFDKTNKIQSIEEKPVNPTSDQAIVGLYFFDMHAVEFAKQIKPSARGELEIVDVLKKYLELNLLNFTQLNLGTAWLDTGTFESLHDAGTFVRLIEERQGISFGDPTQIAKSFNWIK